MSLKTLVPLEAVVDLEVLEMLEEDIVEAKNLLATNPLISTYLKSQYAIALKAMYNTPVLDEDSKIIFAQHQTAISIYNDLLLGE